MLDAENAMHQQEAVGSHHAGEGLCARCCQDTRLNSPSLKLISYATKLNLSKTLVTSIKSESVVLYKSCPRGSDSVAITCLLSRSTQLQRLLRPYFGSKTLDISIWVPSSQQRPRQPKRSIAPVKSSTTDKNSDTTRGIRQSISNTHKHSRRSSFPSIYSPFPHYLLLLSAPLSPQSLITTTLATTASYPCLQTASTSLRYRWEIHRAAYVSVYLSDLVREGGRSGEY